MKGFDLLKAVTDFVAGLLLLAKVSHAGNCLAMSQVMQGLFISSLYFFIGSLLHTFAISAHGLWPILLYAYGMR